MTGALSGPLTLKQPLLVKEALTDATLSIHPQSDALTCLITDASDTAVVQFYSSESIQFGLRLPTSPESCHLQKPGTVCSIVDY